MFECDSMVPLGLVMSSPPKMFGWDEEREPSGQVVSWPPKMLGCEEVRPSGVLQSCPPKMFGWHETCAGAMLGSTNSHPRTTTPTRAARWAITKPSTLSTRRLCGSVLLACHSPSTRRTVPESDSRMAPRTFYPACPASVGQRPGWWAHPFLYPAARCPSLQRRRVAVQAATPRPSALGGRGRRGTCPRGVATQEDLTPEPELPSRDE
jgi:hypothetical protein